MDVHLPGGGPVATPAPTPALSASGEKGLHSCTKAFEAVTVLEAKVRSEGEIKHAINCNTNH